MQSLPDSLDQLAIFTRYRQQVLTCNFHDMQHASSFNTILKGLFHVVHCILDKESIFFLQNTYNIVYFYQTSFSVRILQEKGFPVSLAMKLRKERHFVQRKKRKRGVGQCLWQWDHQYQVRKPQPRLPNHYSFRESEGGWCRLCWFILFLSKKTHYFRSVKFLLALKK